MGAAKVIWHKFKVASVKFLQTKFRAGTKREKKSRRHGLRREREREIGRWQRMVVAGLVLMPYWSFVRPYSAAAACSPE